MLNGVGGRTIEEAKERMSHVEAMQWSAYLQRRGSLHIGRRLEWGFALLAQRIDSALGGHARMADFMPHEQTEQEPQSIADVMKILSGKK